MDDTYLFVKLDIGGLKLLLNVRLAEVVGELVVRVGHALGGLRGFKVAHSRFRHSVQRNGLVLCVSNLVQVHVRDLLVRLGHSDGWIVCGCVARELGEVL